MTDFVDRFEKGSRLRMNDNWVEVESFAIHKDRPLIKLRGIDSVEAAEALQWAFLEAPALAAEDLDDDEYLTEDLIGLTVSTTDGKLIGKIDDVMPMPAHDVLVIGEIMIPAVAEFVKDVDLDAGTMTVQLIPGMLGEDE
jgi:16S rRNA processing protein RimM